MPRTARAEVEGGIHHAILRGNNGQLIFLDDRDRSFFVNELRVTAAAYEWRWLSYCLMSNHVHLVIETRGPTLGRGMRQLAGRHAQRFNRRHDRYGHLFHGRYRSIRVRSDAQFAQLLRYVARNPVKADLCRDPADWRWSSHRAFLRGLPSARAAAERVEALLEPWGGRAGGRYARLHDPTHPVALLYGDESPWEHRPPLDRLMDGCGLREGARAAREHGYTLTEIAAAAGTSPSTVSRVTRDAA